MSGSLTVLGGGNTAFAVAANLTLAGADVTLCELPEFEQMVAPIQEDRQITLEGVARQGVAKIKHVTTDFAAALRENELNLLIVPSYAHRAFAEACAGHLGAGQILVLMPGNMGSLQMARIFRERGGADGLILAETDTAPYVCRKTSATTATIWGVVNGMGLGALPGAQGLQVQKALDPWFPGVQLYPHVVACGLAAMNPVVHPAGVLMNAGRIEYARGEFFFYQEGVMPGVCRVIQAVDQERLAIGRVLEVELSPVAESFHAAGFGPRGDLWSTINGSRMLTQLRAPGKLESRWLTEDVPYGLASWALLGEQLGVPCPTMRSLVDLTSIMLAEDLWSQARTMEELGIAEMDATLLLERTS